MAISCEICKKEFETIKALRCHIKAHKSLITAEEYFNKYLFGIEKCNYEHCKCDLQFERYAGVACCQVHGESQKRLEKYGRLDWICPICKWGTVEDPEQHTNMVGKISNHLTVMHKFDIKQMEEFYINNVKKPEDPDGHCLWCNKDLSFRNLTEGYPKFCYNSSCNVLWYNENTDRKDRASQSTKETYTAEPHRLASRKEYWMAKGFSEEESIKKVSERQVMFSLDICIEKYGEVEGTAIWKERQDKWQTTMKSKSDEEISRIGRAKISNSYTSGYSQISQELFWGLYNTHLIGKYDISDVYFATFNNNGEREEKVNFEFGLVTTNKRLRLLDFYIESLNKCIEFDGDYWHGTFTGNRQRDAEREVEIKETIGCDILHIKENEYKADPTREILKCLEFLNGQQDNPHQEIG